MTDRICCAHSLSICLCDFWLNDEPTEGGEHRVCCVVYVLALAVEPMYPALGVVVEEALHIRNRELTSWLDDDRVTLDPCTHSLILSAQDSLCCAPLIAEDGVVHLQDYVLGVVIFYLIPSAHLPSVLVRSIGKVESDLSGHGAQGF